MPRFGIAYRPSAGRLEGIQVALMRRYGIPWLVDSYDEGIKLAVSQFGTDLYRTLFVTVVPERKAQQLVERVVEVYSGKLIVQGRELVPYSGPEKRCSYQELLPILNRLAKQSAVEAQQRAARQGKSPVSLLTRVKKVRTPPA